MASQACPAAAQAIFDDFGSGSPSPNWFVCSRSENSFTFGPVDGEGRSAATATVRNRRTTGALLSPQSHAGCRNEDGSYTADGQERAELWEAKAVWKPIGTDIWYRFDMFVDDSITSRTGRFVIGQWKQDDPPKDAPLLAQRFNERIFKVTIEQDNELPERNPADVLCRVVIAAQETARSRPGYGDGHDLNAPTLFDEIQSSPPLSIGHDLKGVTHTVAPGEEEAEVSCARDISVEVFAPLPDPFGKWTTMVYHLRIGADEQSLVEIWANGRKISRTTGRIGFRPFDAEDRQFFKFGPYRNPAWFTTLTRLSRYARSEKKADVDPDGTLAPD
ncbi:hypothetical protein F3Y30_18005 [Sinorhizobium sp. BG8]|nr:hypothetical protein F3Y30_18005 [Sinorhizobium sp. BG8]